MANLFNQLPDYSKSPAGRERTILRLLPRASLAGSILIALPALLIRLLPLFGLAPADPKLASTVDIMSIAVMIVFWIALVIVGTGAFLVMLMKGPAYVADPYAMVDSDKPGKRMAEMQPGKAIYQGEGKSPPEQDS
ncbi:hypothetical protein [Noviherbaspirillum sedimenti]|uniref:Uncharacterized protein n=1 Tax=Noviherbaspirillum sedimenti TaxID=2320865 RepID=A0A3A3G0S7_9BURK|nr:hypothetical protein [Noviherbaspirillum sedimenti]RJG00509.1 hypothetical protein D3878_02050 [Noviherbaspirillum sedimenti]